MATNKLEFISKMFVVGITFLIFTLIEKFNILDLSYLVFVISSFIKFIYINNKVEE